MWASIDFSAVPRLLWILITLLCQHMQNCLSFQLEIYHYKLIRWQLWVNATAKHCTLPLFSVSVCELARHRKIDMWLQWVFESNHWLYHVLWAFTGCVISDFFLSRLRGVNSYQMSQCWSWTLKISGSSQDFLNIVALSTFKSQEYCQWSSNHAVAAPSILCVHLLLTLLDLARIRFMSILLLDSKINLWKVYDKIIIICKFFCLVSRPCLVKDPQRRLWFLNFLLLWILRSVSDSLDSLPVGTLGMIPYIKGCVIQIFFL